MRKLTGLVLGFYAVAMVVLLACSTIAFFDAKSDLSEYKKQSRRLQQQQLEQSQHEADTFKYVISEVNGDEINGLAVTRKSFDNGGIVLSKRYDNVNLQVGDIIEVTYGKEWDDIQSVKIVD